MANRFARTRPTVTWAASTAYVLGDRRLSTGTVPARGIHFEVTTAGTSAGTEPAWNTTVGGTTSDGTVTWTTRGSANTWVASTAYVLGDRVIPTGSATAIRRNYVYECTTAGTSGGTEPAWVTTTPDTSTTTDGTVTWTVRDCQTWNNAHPRLTWITGDVSGTGRTLAQDTIFVSHTHDETNTSGSAIVGLQTTSIGNTHDVLRIICVNDVGDPATPTTLATTAVVRQHANSTLTLQLAYVRGITFRSGDGSSQSSTTLELGSISTSILLVENCVLRIDTTSSTPRLDLAEGPIAVVRNCTLRFANIGQTISTNASEGGSFTFEDCTIDSSGSAPTTLFNQTVSGGAQVYIRGCDFSHCEKLFSFADPDANTTVFIENTHIGSAPLFDSIGQSAGARPYVRNIRAVNVGNSAIVNQLRLARNHLTVDRETTLVRTGGAADGVGTYSWKLVTANLTLSVEAGHYLDPLLIWNTATGSAKTATVEFLHDSTTALTDDEIWLEVEYLGSTTTPRSSFVADKVTLLGTPAGQAASSATWTTTGMTNPNKQKLSVTFTPQTVGWVRARVYIAKTNYTLYVDPKITIT